MTDREKEIDIVARTIKALLQQAKLTLTSVRGNLLILRDEKAHKEYAILSDCKIEPGEYSLKEGKIG